MRKNPSRHRGFSLIEALVALCVLGIIVFSLLPVLIYGFGSAARTRQIALATQICQERIETVRNLPFDVVSALGSTFTGDKLARLAGGQGLQAVQSGGGDDIKKLTVSVAWTYRGQTLRKDIVTYVTRMGVDRK